MTNVIVLHNIYKPDDWIAMNGLFTMKNEYDIMQWNVLWKLRKPLSKNTLVNCPITAKDFSI